MTIKPGEAWEQPAAGPPDHEVHGGDADLAAAVAAHPGGRFRFIAGTTSDLARSVGLTAHPTGREVAMDVLAWFGDVLAPPDVVASVDEIDAPVALAVNMLVVGTPPALVGRFTRARQLRVEVDGRRFYEGRATTVVVATGQFLGGANVVPRGHPGDGRAEVLVLHVAPGQRAEMRRRLVVGDHLPHPGITQGTGRLIEVVPLPRAMALEADGRRIGRISALSAHIIPQRYRLLL